MIEKLCHFFDKIGSITQRGFKLGKNTSEEFSYLSFDAARFNIRLTKNAKKRPQIFTKLLAQP